MAPSRRPPRADDGTGRLLTWPVFAHGWPLPALTRAHWCTRCCFPVFVFVLPSLGRSGLVYLCRWPGAAQVAQPRLPRRGKVCAAVCFGVGHLAGCRCVWQSAGDGGGGWGRSGGARPREPLVRSRRWSVAGGCWWQLAGVACARCTCFAACDDLWSSDRCSLVGLTLRWCCAPPVCSLSVCRTRRSAVDVYPVLCSLLWYVF